MCPSPVCAQAHQESNAPVRHAFLAEGRHDRRVAQGDRLDGVLHRKARADEQSARFAGRPIDPDVESDPVVMLREDHPEIGMPADETSFKFTDESFDLVLGNGEPARRSRGPA